MVRVEEADLTRRTRRRAGAGSLEQLRRLLGQGGPADPSGRTALGGRGSTCRTREAMSPRSQRARAGDPHASGPAARRVCHRPVDPADTDAHRPLARGEGSRSCRPAGSRHPVVQARRAQAQGVRPHGVIGHPLPAVLRGAAVVDGGPPRDRPAASAGVRLPRIGAPATRALSAAGIATLEAVAAVPEHELAAIHGVGPVALDRLRRHWPSTASTAAPERRRRRFPPTGRPAGERPDCESCPNCPKSRAPAPPSSEQRCAGSRRGRRHRHLGVPPPPPGEISAALRVGALTGAFRRGKSMWCETSGVGRSRTPGPTSVCTWGSAAIPDHRSRRRVAPRAATGSAAAHRPGRRAGRLATLFGTGSPSPSRTAARCGCSTSAASAGSASIRPRFARPGRRARLGAGSSASGWAAARPRSRPGCSTRRSSPGSATCSPTRPVAGAHRSAARAGGRHGQTTPS